MTLSKKRCSLSPSPRSRCWWATPERNPLFPVGTPCRRMFPRTRRWKDALPRAQTPSWCWNLTQLPRVSSVFCELSLPLVCLGLMAGLEFPAVCGVQLWGDRPTDQGGISVRSLLIARSKGFQRPTSDPEIPDGRCLADGSGGLSCAS